MTIIGMLFNPMNILAYKFTDLYLSLTLFYGGLLPLTLFSKKPITLFFRSVMESYFFHINHICRVFK